ncbi:UNVERIFIED_CONTAM: hypothetical protein GTU68_020091 [Idotea baltica]|nr:hypothetical protein [Idotea baltica]
MGVAGCGKTSVGQSLGGAGGVPFLDGDDFHSADNVEKMRAGEPLTDQDRWPWLDDLGRALRMTADINGRVYAACSALKREYRNRLRAAANESILFVHLDGTRALIASRMAERSNHYMPTTLLDSQFDTLEPLQPDERGCSVNIDVPFDEVVQVSAQRIRAHLPRLRTSEF